MWAANIKGSVKKINNLGNKHSSCHYQLCINCTKKERKIWGLIVDKKSLLHYLFVGSTKFVQWTRQKGKTIFE